MADQRFLSPHLLGSYCIHSSGNLGDVALTLASRKLCFHIRINYHSNQYRESYGFTHAEATREEGRGGRGRREGGQEGVIDSDSVGVYY